MEQMPLVVEDEYEALRHAVAALGGSKVVGSHLWADLAPNKAGEKLANCLNPLRQEKLSISEFLFIRRESAKIGCHVIAAYENQNAGYAPPIPVSPEDEKTEIERKFIEATKTLERLLKRREEILGAHSPVRLQRN